MKIEAKRLFILVTLTLLIKSAIADAQQSPADSLTVDAAVRMAIAGSPALVQAAANIQATNARVDQAQSANLPTASFEGSYARIGPVPQLSFPGLGAFRLFPENNYDAHVGVRQNVYDFGKRSAIVDVTRSRVQSAELTGDLLRLGLAYQTIQVFYSILYLQRSIQVEEREIKTLQEHLAVTKKRTASGSGTEFEVLTTQVRVAAAENQKVDLENMLERQNIALRRILNLPDSTVIGLRGDFQIVPVNSNADSLTAIALHQRPEYRGARADEQTASLQYKLTQVSDLPVLNVNASYGVKNGYLPNLDILRGNWVAGIQLQVPIYEGHKTQYQEQEAEAMLGGSHAHVTDVERQIVAEVRQAVSDVRSAGEKLERSALQVQQATEALSIAQRRFEAGTVSNLDVLDAETSLSQAHLLRLRALYDYVSSRYALEHAIGTPIWE